MVLILLLAAYMGLINCMAQIPSSNLGERAANSALLLQGVPYLLGAKGYENNKYLDAVSIKSIDCSGLVVWAYNTASGPTIISDGSPIFTNDPTENHDAVQIWSNDVDQLGTDPQNILDGSNLEPGDLLFLKNTDTNGVDHVGMYLGTNSNGIGQVIHAKGDAGVEVKTLDEWLNLKILDGTTYKAHFAGYGRVKNSGREGLKQLNQNGDIIPAGGKLFDRTVAFRATLNNPNGKKIKLQVELRRHDEYGGQFDDTAGGFKESDFVENGKEATAYAYGLIDGDYHWRARAVSEDGTTGEWVNFGDDISKADFTVTETPAAVNAHSAGTQQDLQGNAQETSSQESSTISQSIDHKAILSPGWDIFDRPISNGFVAWKIVEDTLKVKFELIGAEANNKYTLMATFFDPDGKTKLQDINQISGWTKYGSSVAPRFNCCREGLCASGPGEITFGYMNTDSSGDGVSQFDFNMPPGTYYTQFSIRTGECWPGKGDYSGCGVVYRTGNRYGDGFEIIDINPHI